MSAGAPFRIAQRPRHRDVACDTTHPISTGDYHVCYRSPELLQRSRPAACAQQRRVNASFRQSPRSERVLRGRGATPRQGCESYRKVRVAQIMYYGISSNTKCKLLPQHMNRALTCILFSSLMYGKTAPQITSTPISRSKPAPKLVTHERGEAPKKRHGRIRLHHATGWPRDIVVDATGARGSRA